MVAFILEDSVYQDAVESAVESLSARFAQEVYIIGNCKFLVTPKS
jgi:hypothetical protein